jgi:hypothetical protein
MLFAMYLVIIIVVVHYAVCVWIAIGNRYLFNDENPPWIIANPEFLEYSDF